MDPMFWASKRANGIASTGRDITLLIIALHRPACAPPCFSSTSTPILRLSAFLSRRFHRRRFSRCLLDFLFIPHNERFTANQRCRCAKTRHHNRRNGNEREFKHQQEAEEGGAEAHHHNRGSWVGAFVLSFFHELARDFVSPLILPRFLQRHVHNIMPRVATSGFRSSCTLGWARPGQVAGRGRRIVEGKAQCPCARGAARCPGARHHHSTALGRRSTARRR